MNNLKKEAKRKTKKWQGYGARVLFSSKEKKFIKIKIKLKKMMVINEQPRDRERQTPGCPRSVEESGVKEKRNGIELLI